MKKDFLLRTTEEIFEKIKEKAKEDDRSITYMINKLIENGLTSTNLNPKIDKELEEYANKISMTKEELIIRMWNTYSKTFKR